MATESPNIFKKIEDNVFMPIVYTVIEIQRLFPDSVLFGTLLLYILTLNKSYGVFSLFMFETTMIHKLISSVYGKTVGQSQSRSSDNLTSCYPGFRAPRKEADRILRDNSFPSLSILTMTSAAAYLLGVALSFKETVDTMGADWRGRFPFAVAFIAVIPIITVLIRFMLGCESTGEIIFAAIAGLIIGLILFVINKTLFGMEGINLLGLPYIVEKDKKGSDIYVCTTEVGANGPPN